MTDIDQTGGQTAGRECTKCGEWKSLDDYYVRKDRGTERRHRECKKCIGLRAKVYYSENKESADERNRLWRAENSERINLAGKEWRRKNPDKARQYQYNWNEKNPEKVKAIEKRRREKDSKNPKAKIRSSVSRSIRKSIRTGSKLGRKSEDILGYTIKELMTHIEKLFKPGMTWENYGIGGWEIDHIIPISVHNYETTDDIDFKKCWAISNLQPLWMTENRSKKDKISAPFQPSLMLRPANDNVPAVANDDIKPSSPIDKFVKID